MVRGLEQKGLVLFLGNPAGRFLGLAKPDTQGRHTNPSTSPGVGLLQPLIPRVHSSIELPSPTPPLQQAQLSSSLKNTSEEPNRDTNGLITEVFYTPGPKKGFLCSKGIFGNITSALLASQSLRSLSQPKPAGHPWLHPQQHVPRCCSAGCSQHNLSQQMHLGRSAPAKSHLPAGNERCTGCDSASLNRH